MIRAGYYWSRPHAEQPYPDMDEEEYEARERARDEEQERRFKQWKEEHD